MKKNISEQTLIKVLVNLKCLGYMGKFTRCFGEKRRGEILDILEQRGLVDKNGDPTDKARPIILHNLALCE